MPLQRRVPNKLRGISRTRRGDPEKLIELLFSLFSPKPATRNDDSDSEPEDDCRPGTLESLAADHETRSVRFKEYFGPRALLPSCSVLTVSGKPPQHHATRSETRVLLVSLCSVLVVRVSGDKFIQ
jgi:hypothetical protein